MRWKFWGKENTLRLDPHMLAVVMIQRMTDREYPFNKWRVDENPIPENADAFVEIGVNVYQLCIFLDFIEQRFGGDVAEIVRSNLITVMSRAEAGPVIKGFFDAVRTGRATLQREQVFTDSPAIQVDCNIAKALLGIFAEPEDVKTALYPKLGQSLTLGRISAESSFGELIKQIEFRPESVFGFRKPEEIPVRWSEACGCFERQLQRRHKNALFPPAKRRITTGENFGDTGASGSGTWTYGANAGHNSKNTATGGIAAHLYVTSGTDTPYTATVTATDGTNTASCQVPVTAYDPAGANGFAGTKTTCVSASGTPVPGSGDCPAGAAVLSTSSFNTALGSAYFGSGKRVLFKCGDTFSGDNVTLTATTASIGAYGGCQGTQTGQPIFNDTSGSGAYQLDISPNSGDLRIADIYFNGNGTCRRRRVHGRRSLASHPLSSHPLELTIDWKLSGLLLGSRRPMGIDRQHAIEFTRQHCGVRQQQREQPDSVERHVPQPQLSGRHRQFRERRRRRRRQRGWDRGVPCIRVPNVRL